MPAKKHPIEWYKDYKISIISGISPTMFTAEKDDPCKGKTLTNENLEELKNDIDKALDYALSIKIDIWAGQPERNSVIQNINTRINLNGVRYNGFSFIVQGDSTIDYDLVLDAFVVKHARMSKGQKKKGNGNFNKKRLMMLHACIITGERR